MFKLYRHVNLPMICIIFVLMIMGMVTISLTTQTPQERQVFFTPIVLKQITWCVLGWGVYFLFSLFDYLKLKSLAPFLYIFLLVTLLGLFLFQPVHSVHRWYRILPFFDVQPSSPAKLILIITLSAFLEVSWRNIGNLKMTAKAFGLLLLPTILILKQPDLGTALILFLMGCLMIWFVGGHGGVLRLLKKTITFFSVAIMLVFLGVISYERIEPICLKVMKEYQYRRIMPGSYHQKACLTSIGLGGWGGVGYGRSDYSGKRWLPAAHTDSVFSAFGEHFGLLGLYLLIGLFFLLVYLSGEVAKRAKDRFGQMMAVGITLYLALHIGVNMGMMCGLLPITGVPLLLMTYGGSSMVCTMAALGIVQSIHMRRFRF